MVVFLARSALCIGVVAAAASGVGPDRLTAALGRGTRVAADGAGRACLASSRCLRVGAQAMTAAAGFAPGAADASPPIPAAPTRPGPRADRVPVRAARP